MTNANAVQHWTTTEEKILREHYSTPGGMDKCIELLSRRTRSSIYQHALKLGLKACHGGKHQYYETNDFIDNAIRQAYQKPPVKGAIQQLANRLNRPRYWVTKRATALGLITPRFKEPPWCEQEIEILEQHGHRALETIQRALARQGFKRTTTAIHVKRKRLHIDTHDPNNYTAHGVATLMGVDSKTVLRWIEKLDLKASRRGTARTDQQGGDQYQISRKNLRQWIADNATHMDLRKVDKFWFIDLMAGRYEAAAEDVAA